jgi:hypothetical protein
MIASFCEISEANPVQRPWYPVRAMLSAGEFLPHSAILIQIKMPAAAIDSGINDARKNHRPQPLNFSLECR